MNSGILFQNVSNTYQEHWVFVGLPKDQLPREDAGYLSDGPMFYPWCKDRRGIWARVNMHPGTMLKLEYAARERKPEQFQYHDALREGLMQLMPRFRFDDETAPIYMTLVNVTENEACQLWHLRGVHQTKRVTVDFWARIFENSTTIEFTTEVVYGNVINDNQPQVVQLPTLFMESPLYPHVDFRVRNGYAALSRNEAMLNWIQPLVTSGTNMHRASRFQMRGALLAGPDEARKQSKPIQGLYMGWDGDWMVLGAVPARTPEVEDLRKRMLAAYKSEVPGLYDDPRPRIQTRSSGTTGEQSDFGWASDLAVTADQPWEIHDALWQCQGYAIRPTGNKEPDGSPMMADRHISAETMGQRPDLFFGVRDRLGWPKANQIGWIPSTATVQWTTSDDQHRADNFLHATYALTQDPALEQLIRDHVELDKTDIYILQNMSTSSRAIGRLALTRANQLWLGFDSEKALRKAVNAAISNATMTLLPADRPVTTFGGREQAKYGWTDRYGQAIIGWQPWQEAIAAVGIYAAAKVLGISEYKDAAYKVAKAVCTYGWRKVGDHYTHAYALRWNDGVPFHESSWPSSTNSYNEGWTEDIYVSSACDYWTLSAAKLVSNLYPEAAQLVAYFGKPRSVTEARWRAI
jgi:hypothetical protein